MSSSEFLDALSDVKSGRVSLPQSCADAIAAEIIAGAYAPGAQLPAEAQMASNLGVSRATLRDALRQLQDRGLIIRRHGRGTFVAKRPIRKDLNRNFGITAMIRDGGYRPGTSSLELRMEAADRQLALSLGLTAGDPVTVLDRTRLADDRPVVWSRDAVPRRFLDIADAEAMSDDDASLYGLLYKLHQVTVYRGVAELSPKSATASLADRLQVRRGAPLLYIKQVDYDGSGTPVVCSVEYHVSDWISFTLERVGPGAAVDL
ncbi:MAG TPA: GntR family transcriptional regulator [Streptosporangiaceae bacterium]|nr:GntR family transcriptional regulator [Streptosporangiaceae bacterium]